MNVCGKYHHTSILLSKGFPAKEIFGFIYTNVCASMATIVHGGAKYF
jgi:hypothetical protein